METKELMIGDLVNLGYRDLTLKVIGLDYRKKTILVEAQDNFKLQISYDEEEVNPIPLTDEILKKNGFENETADFWKLRVDDKPHHYAFRLNKGGALCVDGYSMVCNIYTITIKYVHELQHALRLCGLKELAANFKV